MIVTDLKYADILAQNRVLGEELQGKEYRAAILSNITTRQLVEVLEYTLRSQGVRATVQSGEYDQIVSDSASFRNADLCVVIWELANLIEGFQYKAGTMDEHQYEELLAKSEREILLVFEHLRDTPLVVLNLLSAVAFTHGDLTTRRFAMAARRLNEIVEKHAPSNVVLVDVDKILAELSVSRSIDYRYYLSSKALYTVEFWKAYAGRIAPNVLSILGKTKKALIFDCDNTLWHGIVGEDGIAGIEMTPQTATGAAFAEVQHVAKELAKGGVIVGLCSKNNPADVDEVLRSHPGMVIASDLVIRKVNWQDKVTNLREIARELNIGLDSLVFVDDSAFELGLIRGQLPEVTVVQVPERIHEYPGTIRAAARLFHSVITSAEDAMRPRSYAAQADRERDRETFKNIDDYLRSLGLEVTVRINDPQLIPRAAQLTQKTNQFNLTTKRYTESELRRLIEAGDHDLLTFDVRDRYGEYGVTAVCLARIDNLNRSAELDTLLMSCRILGRNLELACSDAIVARLRDRGVESVAASYRPTAKNSQVEGLYERLGFDLMDTMNGEKRYRLGLATYEPFQIDYIG